MVTNDVTIYQAVAAGVISFISPCVPSLIFICAALVAGFSGANYGHSANGARLTFLALTFLLGVVLIFTLTASSSSLGVWVSNYQTYLRVVGGGVTILAGFFTVGISWLVTFLQKNRERYVPNSLVYPLVFLIGIGFSSGWTPCIGPTLGKILISASVQGTATYGVIMLAGYSVGLIIPFMIIPALLTIGLNRARNRETILRMIMTISGATLVAGGVILIMDNLRQLTPLFPDLVSY